MVLKHDGIIMAKDIIEFPEGTDGFDLIDKSEKITDTEIFFNNADDSVVHVEIDGTSVQDGEPTPDAPIEVHSLNNFDIVSSVEKLTEGQLEEYDYGVDYENVNKINLSLSKPLRSIGDVKDRLFRDSDGLWKIQRKIAQAIFDGSEDLWDPNNTNDQPDTFGFYVNKNWFPGGVVPAQSPLNQNNMFPFIEGDIAPVRVHGINYEGLGWVNNDMKISINRNRLISLNLNGLYDFFADNPLIVQFELETPTIEVLSEEYQNKLNNIPSFKNSNYIYTITDNDLEPTLHARFKSEDYGILNNDYGINYPDKITYLGTYFKHGDLVTQEFIESED